MYRTADYFITTIVALVLAWLVVVPIVSHVAQSMDNSANMIAKATTQ
jgi:F0F1-type ATP synthase membrane subunit b/b'